MTLPARTLRAITSNVESLDQWLDGVCDRQVDHDAIVKRMATMAVTESLYARPGVTRTAKEQQLLPRKRTFAEAMVDMTQGF